MTDNSIQVDPNALIRVQPSNQSGEEFPIGDNAVQVTATDEAGNVGTCSFLILVRGNYFLGDSLFVYNICLIRMSDTPSDKSTKILVQSLKWHSTINYPNEFKPDALSTSYATRV